MKALGLAVASALVVATSAAAQAAPEDLASGSGTFDNQFTDGTKFNFTAHGTPLAARGNAHFDIGPEGDVKADVDCLKVQGNRAALSGTLERPAFGATRYILLIRDNGQGKADQPDDGYFILWYGAPRSDCGFGDFASQFTGTNPIARGNWVIQDR
jgi:hypothetical protein